ncbi:MAG: SGNH/GDSL hydrolase family protein [Gemmatimonadota bacterium]|nr:SGNH/GDSL hydrolase family protein [Gemmatimonadota bacterium]
MRNSFTSSFSGYLRRMLLALATVLTAALAASVALVRYVVEPNDRVVQGLHLMQQATASNGAFGDSHFAWGFVGSPDFPTFAGEGETIADMELRIRYYFRNRRPGQVIVQGDPHAFAAYKLDRQTHGYLANLDNPTFTQRVLDHHRQYLYLYWGSVLEGGFASFRGASELKWGWILAQEQWWSKVDPSKRVGEANARMEHQMPVADVRTSPFAASFARTLAFLESRGASVCVVTTPVTYEYFRFASDDPRTQAALQLIRETAAAEGARYVDLLDLYARPQFAGYFRDPDHLNRTGAPLFTERAIAACFGSARGTVVTSTN